MHVKSFGIVMLKGSVISENRAPFYIYNYNIKKRKYQEKITINFLNLILPVYWYAVLL